MITLNVTEDTAQALYTLMLSLDINSELWNRTRQLFRVMEESGMFSADLPRPGLVDPNIWTWVPKYPHKSTLVITEEQ